MKNKIIFHLDMDQFFVAVELQCYPELRGKPVVVGGDPHGRGIVTTSSYEARRYGVRSGMPTSDAYKLCPHAVFIKPDSSKYVHASRQVFLMLREFTDRVEPVSVDEAYLDVTDVVQYAGGIEALARTIKRTITERTGLTATIGVGANRVAAKMASGMNKPDGFTYLPPERIAAVFENMPVGELIGVGRSTERVLESFGIRTIGQLAAFPEEILRRRFGKYGADLHRLAHGQGSDEVCTPEECPDEKSMGHEHTFGRDIADHKELLGRLHLLSERVARRMRTGDMVGQCVTIKIRYKGFETVMHGHRIKRFIQHEMDIYAVAEKLFDEAYEAGRPVRLVGVCVSHLVPTSRLTQQELFVAPSEPSVLTRTCDLIKDRFGELSIGFASGVFFAGGRSSSNSRRTTFYNPFAPRSWQ
ncbi:MAG: DNA polymerase IV [Calditrichota bacterium]